MLPVRLPCDSLVHQTLLKSVRQSLVHQAVSDKGSSFSQRRLQLPHVKQVHINSLKKKSQNATCYSRPHRKRTNKQQRRAVITNRNLVEAKYLTSISSLKQGFVLTLVFTHHWECHLEAQQMARCSKVAKLKNIWAADVMSQLTNNTHTLRLGF